MRMARVVWPLSAVLLAILTVGPVFAQVGGHGTAAPQTGGIVGTGGTVGQMPAAPPQSLEPVAPAPPADVARPSIPTPPTRPATVGGRAGLSPIFRPPPAQNPRATPGSRRSARGRGIPVPPTAYGTANQYLSSDAGAASGSVATVGTGPSRWPSALPAKPFANFVPSSPISPYMNLFRYDTAFGTIDNYNSRVRPLLDQQRVNQQTGNRIRSLQLQGRTRGTQIRQLGRQTQTLQGLVLPSSFMDYGGYYPRLGQ